MRRMIDAIVTGAIMMASLLVSGSVPAGSWKVHPAFAPPPMSVVAMQDAVYYLSGGSLFAFFPSTGESLSLTAGNLLSDGGAATGIYHNPMRGYLLVAYESGNIDLILGDGTVRNIPDIKLSTVTGSKRINDVAFADDRIYLATDFGIVEMNDRRLETIGSAMAPQPVTAVAVMGSRLVVTTGNTLRIHPRSERLSTVDRFTTVCPWTDCLELQTLDENTLISRRSDDPRYLLVALRLDPENNRLISFDQLNPDGKWQETSSLRRDRDGNLWFVADGDIHTIGPDASAARMATLPPAAAKDIVGRWDNTSLWTLNTDGLAEYTLAGGSWSLTTERFAPEKMSVKNVAYIIPSPDGKRIYFTNLGVTAYRLGYSTGNEGLDVAQATSMFDTDKDEFFILSATDRTISSPTRLAEAPEDPSTYFIGSGNDGLFRITDGEVTGRYTASNAPFGEPWGVRVYEATTDAAGNLWVGADGLTSESGIMVLPADKLPAPPESLRPSDWTVPSIPGYVPGKDVRILHCCHSDMVFIINSGKTVTAYDTRGTLDDFSDDRSRVWHSFTDQDGKQFAANRYTSLCEDRSGRVWIGTSTGVIEITRPAEAVDPGMTVRRIKVPRNDGSGFADYLAGDDMVYDIATDNADRKWIATAGSGAILASADGDEIVTMFNSSNSPLQSNLVNSVYADRTGNSVYFGTPQGLYEYGSSATPPAADFSEIKVYPNPVRPDYSGPVNITGLMDGSLVKIADASGRVVWQGQAEGGSLQWPACDYSGRRVATGVYYILASRTGDSVTPSGATAKVTVVN